MLDAMDDVFFFFSSRRRHTRCLSDWSSDVCSSDLVLLLDEPATGLDPQGITWLAHTLSRMRVEGRTVLMSVHGESAISRSEERRVGKEGRVRWWAEQREKNIGQVAACVVGQR